MTKKLSNLTLRKQTDKCADVEVRIIYAVPDTSDVSDGLRYLTQVLSEHGEDIFGGLLGGEYGYGAYFENDVFMMHPYCWCEKDDCPWCAGCECPDSAFHYFTDGQEVDLDEWMAFFEREAGQFDDYGNHEAFVEWEKRADEVNKRRTERHDPVCKWCVDSDLKQPNFLHKPSRSKVSWYKYIGRDNEIELHTDWSQIMDDCLASLRVSSKGSRA
jgi:hypothetical protein